MNTRNLIRIVVACLVLTAATLALAQEGRQGGRQGGPPPLPDEKQILAMVDELAERLSLSAVQKERIADLHLEHFDDVRELTEGGRPDRTAMRSLREAFETEVKALLDDDQKALFDELQNRRRQHRGGQGRGRR